MEQTYLSDLHTHSLASGHSYSTIREMAYAASQKGLKVLGITEHGPAMPGTCHSFYFNNLKVVPRDMCGVELLLGAELNIIRYDGQVDLEETTLRMMDVCIASLHTPCLKPGTRKQNTAAYLKAMENPYVNIIGHPDDGRYPVDYEALVAGAKKHRVLIELNNASLSPTHVRKNCWDNDRILLEYCRQMEVPVILSSDAHVDALVGDFRLLLPRLAEIGFPQELIVNNDLPLLRSYVNRYKNNEKEKTKKRLDFQTSPC